MSSGTLDRSERMRAVWFACATLLLTTLVAALARRAAGVNAAAVVACIYAGGSLAAAWLTSRVTAFPRWAWFASAGVFALTMVVTAVRLPSPAQVKEWMSLAWMLPWLHIVTATTPAPKSGWCSPSAPWSGFLLVGVSVLYAAILLGTSWFVR